VRGGAALQIASRLGQRIAGRRSPGDHHRCVYRGVRVGHERVELGRLYVACVLAAVARVHVVLVARVATGICRCIDVGIPRVVACVGRGDVRVRRIASIVGW